MKWTYIPLICSALLGLAGCGQNEARVEAAKGGPPSPPPPQEAVIDLHPGTVLNVRLQSGLDTRRNRPGDRFTAALDEPLVAGNQVIVPKGTLFSGRILDSRDSGRFKGRAVLSLTLDSFELNGQVHAIRSTSSTSASRGHKRHNWLWFGGGSGGGAAIGAIAAGGPGALIGAGAGAAAGTVGAAITGKQHVYLPVETRVSFRLQSVEGVEQAATIAPVAATAQ